MASKGTLFVEDGSMTRGATDHLRGLGYNVLPIIGVESIKRLGGGLPDMTLRQWYKGQLATNVYFGGAGMNDESKQAELERMANFIGRIADALITEDQSHG